MITKPRIPFAPVGVDHRVELWMESVRTELVAFADTIENSVVDRKLVGDVVVQSVVAGFTVDPLAPVIRLTATTPVSSDTTTAIKAGHTSRSQPLTIINIGASDITIKNNASVKLRGAADKVLETDDALMLMWDGATWRQVSYESDN